jgi:hypothetical protein
MNAPAFLRLASLTALVVLAACSTGTGSGSPESAPAPAPAPPDISGQWSGFVSVEGQGIDGTLVVEQEGGALEVVFQAPSFGLVAEGAGDVSPDGTVSISLLYDLQCPGEARMLGDVSGDGLSIDGQLDAGDCTGSMSGNFRFTR